MSYVLAFLGFAALIILHEAGHFTAAKAVGMRVERFSLFFGPLLVKFRRGETEYGIGPIPLGGYVKITGMNPNEDIPPEVVPRAYYNQKVWKRVVVILAGPAVNLLIAFVIFWALALSQQSARRRPPTSPRSRRAPASAAILRAGRPDRLGRRRRRLRDRDPQPDRHPPLRRRPGQRLRRGDAGAHRRPPRRAADDVRDPPALQRRARTRPLLGFDFGSTSSRSSAARRRRCRSATCGTSPRRTVSVVARLFEPQERKQLHSVVGGYTATQESFATSTTQAL